MLLSCTTSRLTASGSMRLLRLASRSMGGGHPLLALMATDSSSNAPLAPPDIAKLARMAQIKVTEQEIAEWEPQITKILDWFGELQAVDVTGVPPAVHAQDDGNVLRPDTPAVYANREAIMSQVPEQQGGFVRVPKITTGADSTSSATDASSTASSMDATTTSSSSSSTATSSSDDEAANSSSSKAPELGGAITPEELASLAALDIRVGRIISCERHPDADSLYVEKIDVGEPEPRTIVSGLVKYVPLEAMQQRPVIVLCNLKARNMRGIKSHGMLLAASDKSHETVEPLTPPEAAPLGSRVWFGQHREQGQPLEPNPLQKKKVWEAVQPLLRTDDTRAANFKGAVMQTAEGPVTCSSLASARIG